jgi:hypothetical protein
MLYSLVVGRNSRSVTCSTHSSPFSLYGVGSTRDDLLGPGLRTHPPSGNSYLQFQDTSDIFKRRATEGAYEVLVRRHLHCIKDKFTYFRLTPVLIDYAVNYIKGDLTSITHYRFCFS